MNNPIVIIGDTAGREFFGKLRPSYYRGASAALIFCNIYDKSSIESIPNWIREFKKYIPTQRLPISIAVVKNHKETIKKEKSYIETLNYSISPKHHKKKRSFLQIMKKILFSGKKKAKIRKTIYRKDKPSTTPKEWLTLSNSELVSHIALKYELGICNVDMKNSKDILKCFTQLAIQAINL